MALADLLIGITALELGYDVATHNLRHFRMIPGLNVISLEANGHIDLVMRRDQIKIILSDIQPPI